MRYLLTLAFITFSLSVYAQRISFAPTSFKAWGMTPDYSSVYVSYKGFGVHYFHPRNTYYWNPSTIRRYRSGRMYNAKPGTVGEYLKEKTLIVVEGRGFVDPGYETKPAFALSYSPISIKDIVSVGIILFDKPFPSKPAQRLNVRLELGYTLGSFRLSYVHISNAYTGDINPGLDMISVSLSFKD